MSYISKCFLFLALTSYVVLWLSYLTSGSQSSSPVSSKRYSSKSIRSRHALQDSIMSAAEKFRNSYRKCLLNRLGGATKIWEEMQSAIDSCLEKKFLRALDVHRTKLEFEHHLYFILPISTSSSCVAVRLNINDETLIWDMKPEKTLRNLLPECKFHGAGVADEIYYRPIGKFYKKVTSIVEPPAEWWEGGNGHRINIANMPQLYPFMATPKTLLEKIIKQPQIDYLWLHEGLGFGSVGHYLEHKSVFHIYSVLLDPINVTVCQVMLWSRMTHKDDKGIDYMGRVRPFIKPLIQSILLQSPFLLLKCEYSKKKEVWSQFYVNTLDPVCVKKFLIPVFCQGEECPAEDEDEDYDDDFIVDH